MPFHPLTVHFPIALLFVAGAAYLIAIFREPSFFQRSGFYLHILGVVGMVVSILTGRQAEGNLSLSPQLEALVDQHELMGYLSLWLMGMLLIWQYIRRKKEVQVEKILFVLIFGAGLALMAYGAHIGGEMVYEQGAGIVRP